MKTKEELNAIKEEVEAVSKKLTELTPEEIEQVTGGFPMQGKGEPRNPDDFCLRGTCRTCRFYHDGCCHEGEPYYLFPSV